MVILLPSLLVMVYYSYMHTSGRQNSGSESTNTRPAHSFNSFNIEQREHVESMYCLNSNSFSFTWHKLCIQVLQIIRKYSLSQASLFHPWKPILEVWTVLDCNKNELISFFNFLELCKSLRCMNTPSSLYYIYIYIWVKSCSNQLEKFSNL